MLKEVLIKTNSNLFIEWLVCKILYFLQTSSDQVLKVVGNGTNSNNIIINTTKNDSTTTTTTTTKEILLTTKKSINNINFNNNNNNVIRSIKTIRNNNKDEEEKELNLPIEELLKLDRYAKIFIPDWLKIINNLQPYQFINPSNSELNSTLINFKILKDSLFPNLLQNLILNQILENRIRISKTLIILSTIPLPPIIIPSHQQQQQQPSTSQQQQSIIPSHRIIPQKPNHSRVPPPPGFKNVTIDDRTLTEAINKPIAPPPPPPLLPPVSTIKRLEKVSRLKNLPDLLDSTYAMRFLPLLHVELEGE